MIGAVYESDYQMRTSLSKISATSLILFLAITSTCAARDVVRVPPGNRNSEQPTIPSTSALRAKAFSTTYEEKYEKILTVLRQDKSLMQQIKKAADTYQIDPIHIIGALVGEHTYNITIVDRVQSYYVKALAYSKADFTFSYKGVSVQSFVKRPEFARCNGFTGSTELWECRDEAWDQNFRGKTVDGVSYENMTFQRAFFQPFYAGQTFGLGQISPLTALEVTDRVHATSGLPKLSPDDPQAIYRDIMDPARSVLYIAAIIRDAIEAYRDQGFDISDNPGLTATLYNVGQPRRRALALRQDADKPGGRKLPEENYYGWLVNEKLTELQGLLAGS
ncbi:DUF1402 family protein [Rhizobium sp. ICMP 5592]|uniref:DUF1402 family protein n=1 Tax=Rhizobium sp. ICMP 5592 TaxID=2292445 RepID=UPI001295124F|nr:DUF1402 family protein [Rhizobium sp. ICMP 5592]MQB43290.1 DUF1402 family protein [Rhizobium sp. ICMP 5592]